MKNTMFLSVATAILLLSSPLKAESDNASVYSIIQNESNNNYSIKKNKKPVSTEIHRIVSDAALRHGVPTHIAHGVIKVESRYNCNARNPSGASGLGQMLPATFRSMGGTGSIFNCYANADASMRYLKLALNRGGVGCAGISLYERGLYAQPMCTGYGKKVLSFSS